MNTNKMTANYYYKQENILIIYWHPWFHCSSCCYCRYNISTIYMQHVTVTSCQF
jgi:hypothetical protein